MRIGDRNRLPTRSTVLTRSASVFADGPCKVLPSHEDHGWARSPCRRRASAPPRESADFEGAGFTTTAIDSVTQPVQLGLGAYHDALACRPQAKFEMLAMDEFATGLARLRQDADAEADLHEISERYDVLVFAAR